MVVDQVVQRQANIHEALHGIQTVPVNVLPELRGVVCHRVHHLAIRFREPDVVLEEVAVAVHVSHDDLLIHEVIAFEQIRIAWVIVDDHLINLMQPVRVALVEPLVLHAELPMRIPVRKPAVSRNHIHFFEVENLEECFKEVESVFAGVLFDFDVEPRELGSKTSPAFDRQRHGYLPFPRKSLIDW